MTAAADAPRMPWFRRLVPGSLQVRLLLVTATALGLALTLAGFVLHNLFHEHVQQQFQLSLVQQLDQVTARFTLQANGQPTLDPKTLSDPRWQQPYSGLYWQVDEVALDGRTKTAVLRSRSLWDSSLHAPRDELPDGTVHLHEARGPQDAHLLLLERTVRLSDQPGVHWRMLVGADLKDTHEAIDRFGRVLTASLVTLFVLLVVVAIVQLAIGLRPLRVLQRELQDVQHAVKPNLQGHYPIEIQPLVHDFNEVLDQNRRVVERARTQAGNLAHALKTPLSVLGQAATHELSQHDSELARLVQEQVATAGRHIDWHLARARVSASRHLPGQRTDVITALKGLIRVMERVHAERGLTIDLLSEPAPAGSSIFFAGEEQDLQEILGNLLDNACKWAVHHVDVTVARLVPSAQVCITIKDDGPGIAAEHLQSATMRGVRLDETVPGSGLGLAIAQELAELYGGRLVLDHALPTGLQAHLYLPIPGSTPSRS